MSSSAQVTLRNLTVPRRDAVVNFPAGLQQGLLTPLWDLYFANLMQQLAQLSGVRVSQYGARFNGKSDDAPAIQQALQTALSQGGGIVYIDQPGTLGMMTPLKIPANSPPVVIMGLGKYVTQIKRLAALPAGVGLIDIASSNVSLVNFGIDGGVTAPTGLQYNAGFNSVITMNDPMAPPLTTNTSVWVHGNVSNISFEGMLFTHAAGYSLLLDATLGLINRVDIFSSWFINNRPTSFGSTPGALIFGSWNGGLFVKGDGRVAGSGTVKGLRVDGCRFERVNGNCCWSHLYGLNELHEDFRITDCNFEDTGLDAILMGGVSGGIVSDNVFHRVGYTTVDDTTPATPRWLAGFAPVGIDSAGVVKGVIYEGNSFLSINGGMMDLDGHGLSSLSGNTCRVPYSDEPEYAEDRIAISGVNNNGSMSYGCNLNNSNQTPYGAYSVDISENTFINLPLGALRLYAARNCKVTANLVEAPATSSVPPVIFGPVGSGPNQRCYGNQITDNDIYYSPVSPASAIFEDDTISAFLSTEINYVSGNKPIGNGNAVQFTPSPHSGSTPPTPVTGAAVAGAVTLNGAQGIATSESLTTAAGATYTLTLTNSVVAAGANIMVTVSNGTNTGGAAVLQSVVPAAGSVVITVVNVGTSAFNGTLEVAFLMDVQ
jgi:hypothetical protein